MRVVSLGLALLVLVVGGWTAAWFYVSGEAGRRMEAWMIQERAEGRRWTCPDRAIGGFPFGLTVTCVHPTFAGPVLDDQANGALGALTVSASLSDPHRAKVTLGAPFTYRTGDGQTDFTIRWSQMAVTVDGLPDRVATATISGTDIAADGRFGDPVPQAVRAANAGITLMPVVGAPDPTVDFAIAIGGVGVPVLDTILGGTQPADLAFAGRLTQAVLEDAPSLPALIEHWREVGGAITFSALRIARGPSAMEASGHLQLDAAHRVEGTLDANLIGLAPILRRYGINPNLAAAGAILNSLFGGNRNGGTKPSSDPNAIRLPIQFRDGRLGVGPVVTPVALPPLY